MRLAWLVVLALVLLPAVAARPTLLAVEVGYATQGSHENWYDPTTCIEQVAATYRLTLTILTGAPTDRLVLVVPGVAMANATFGSPAYMEVEFGTACDLDFDVDGASVNNVATYKLDIQ